MVGGEMVMGKDLPIWVLPSAGVGRSGAPVRVGSNLKLQVLDQSLVWLKSVAWARQENWVMAPPAAARSVSTPTLRTAVDPEPYVSRLGSEVTRMVPGALVFHSSNRTPRTPPLRSDTGAYSVTLPSPMVMRVVQEVAGEVVRPEGLFGLWL
ncbi:hypothetical protein DRA43_02605 [Micromonospora provocatoris]|nr:hypothetical protein [Micromonospora provocatoris]RBJ10466.1 hypothetical protein DRA43_02605 [Micromonospora provocatoris]